MDEGLERQAGEERGFLAGLVDVYVAPGEGFASLVRRPRFVVPLAGLIATNVVFAAVWTANMDPREFVTAQIEASGQVEKIPPERRAQVVETQARFMRPLIWASVVVLNPLIVVGLAGLLLFVYRFFYASEVDFKAALTIVATSFLAVALVTLPLTVLVMYLKGDWNLDPNTALQANLSLLFDPARTARPLYSLCQSLDLVSFWTMFLLAAGFGVASRRPVSSTLWGVAVPWGLYVIAKVGLTALLS